MKKVLVIGAAKSGVAAANFLAGRGIAVTLADSKQADELPLASKIDAAVTRAFGGHDTTLLDGVDTIVLSPGVPASIPLIGEARRRRISVISEVELAFRNLQGRVIAITGSNGKSTTTALIGEILEAAGMDPIVAGNIGEPWISSVDDKPRIYVIELSSFQLETVETFHADVALLLNITPDHMDRYDTLGDYAAAKFRIFRNQTSADVAIVNADDRAADQRTRVAFLIDARVASWRLVRRNLDASADRGGAVEHRTQRTRDPRQRERRKRPGRLACSARHRSTR
jgi:UDP-N-acetylmuramoylalanine--D-glutamate ligase